MPLIFRVDAEIHDGEKSQCFLITVNDEKLLINFYRGDEGKFKVLFEGPKSFQISRFKGALPTARAHQRTPK